ncbi:MAG: hypothetical protein H6Q76_2707 [Firmicutes bacterium]|nr:hypothetical protein [Bacillota bacterium]
MYAMYPYFMYLLYVGAVVGMCILLLRRDRRRRIDRNMPTVIEAALLRGGPGAVVETVIFKLNEQGIIELKANGSQKKLLAVISREQQAAISEIEEAAIVAFIGIQGSAFSKNIRKQFLGDLREMEEDMRKAGWWKTPARLHWLITILAPGLIAVGSLRFLNYYEGGLQWMLALTVPIFAVWSRRVILREISGPTFKGKNLLKKLQAEYVGHQDPLWQVALFGTQSLKDRTNYRLFYFMTRGVPYEKL